MAQALHYAYHISANGTYLIKAGLGTIGTVTVNSRGTGGNTLTLYDGTDATGTVLAVIDTTAAQGSYLFDLLIGTGIFVELVGGVAADVTVAWY